MLVWIAMTAHGRDILLDDFDRHGRLGEWTDTSPIHSSGEPTGYFFLDRPEIYTYSDPWDDLAGICNPWHGLGGYCEATSTPDPVTHTRMSVAFWSEFPDGSFHVYDARSGKLYGSASQDTVEVWEIHEFDVVGCGREVTMVWKTWATPYAFYAMDDLTATGDVCPSYVDGDGDGLCPAGTDRDGDGTCVDFNEPGSLDVIEDCDDTVAGTNCLSLVQGVPVSEEPFEVAVTGALPGERVGFVISDTLGTTTCPPRLGGLCVDVGTPLAMRFATADIYGRAAVTVTVPATVAYGTVLYFQAAAARGIDSIKSNVASDFVVF